MMDAILNWFKPGVEEAEEAEGAKGTRDLLTTLF
jgi:hypothetical protein